MTWAMNASRTETMMAASVVSLNKMKKIGAENTDPMVVSYKAKQREREGERLLRMKHCPAEGLVEKEGKVATIRRKGEREETHPGGRRKMSFIRTEDDTYSMGE